MDWEGYIQPQCPKIGELFWTEMCSSPPQPPWQKTPPTVSNRAPESPVSAPPCGQSLYWRFLQWPQMSPQPSHTLRTTRLTCDASSLPLLSPSLPLQPHCWSQGLDLLASSFVISQPSILCCSTIAVFLKRSEFTCCCCVFIHSFAVITLRIRMWRWPMRIRSCITTRRSRQPIPVSHWNNQGIQHDHKF